MNHPPMKFAVNVSWSTHDLLKEGVIERGVNTVWVLAHTDTEATLVAAQMTACHNVMPTATSIVYVEV